MPVTTTTTTTRRPYQSDVSLRAGRHRYVSRACIQVLEERRLFSFAPAVSYPVGAGPLSVVAVDLNRDGNSDLATANATEGTVSVRLGDGAGGFGSLRPSVTGAGPLSITAGDFDGDGIADVATLRFDGEIAYASVLPGRGDGTFRAPVHTMVWEEPLAMAAADFNGDGRSDLVYSFADLMNWDSSIVAVLLSNGQGGFTLSVDHINQLTGTSPVGLAVGDVDADGNVDVVIADDLAGTVSVLLGNGDGTLDYDAGRPRDFAAGPSPQAVAIGDFTGDGTPDLVVTGKGVGTLRGRGDGGFDAAVVDPVDGAPHTAVATADFNGDGRLDAAVTDQDTGTVSVMFVNADGTLVHAGVYATGPMPSAIVVADFDGNGRPDLAATNRGSSTLSVLLNDGDWSSTPLPSVRIVDATVTEGNSGTANTVFLVTLSAPSAQPVTVRYSTVDGTATAGVDYDASAGTLTFAPGQTTAAIVVPVRGDRIAETYETFVVRLADPTGAFIADGEGTGFIIDDEPRLAVKSAQVTEGKSGTKVMTFSVTLSAAYDQPVTVNYATRNGTAVAGEDYVARTGTLTFAAGGTIKTFTVTIFGDKKLEADETFFVDLLGASSNALIATSRGTGTILDDDRRR